MVRAAGSSDSMAATTSGRRLMSRSPGGTGHVSDGSTPSASLTSAILPPSMSTTPSRPSSNLHNLMVSPNWLGGRYFVAVKRFVVPRNAVPRPARRGHEAIDGLEAFVEQIVEQRKVLDIRAGSRCQAE